MRCMAVVMLALGLAGTAWAAEGRGRPQVDGENPGRRVGPVDRENRGRPQVDGENPGRRVGPVDRENRREGREGWTEWRALQDSLRQARQAHFEAQRQANKAFRDSIQGEAPNQRAALLAAHRRSQHSANVAFIDSQHARRIEFLRSHAEGRPGLADRIAFMERIHAMIREFANSRHEKNMQVLDMLAAQPDLTADEMHAAIRARMEQAKAETEAFRSQLRAMREAQRPEREEGRGRGQSEEGNPGRRVGPVEREGRGRPQADGEGNPGRRVGPVEREGRGGGRPTMRPASR